MALAPISAKEKARLKYAGLREQKKHKSLIVIDNRPYRIREIRAAQNGLKKIDRLDAAVQQFHQTDQRLFNDWRELTFRDLTETISGKREEYFALADFQNQMILVAKRQKISIPQAYRILREEEIAYANGDPETRAKIDAIRAQRLDEVERELQEAEISERLCQCPACQAQRREEELSEERPGSKADGADFLHPELRERLDRLEKMKPEQLRELLLEKPDLAMFILVELGPMLMRNNRADLIRKIWTATPASVKQKFNRTAGRFGKTFDEVIDDLESESEATEDFEDFEDFDDDDDFINENVRKARHHPGNVNALSEDDQLKLKSTYRRIARQIHPDRLDEEFLQHRKVWLDRIWANSVRAHNVNDLKTLTRLYHQVLIVFREFDSLSIGELRAAAASMQEEIYERESEIKRFKSNPAWNFSKLKDYTKLTNKVAKPYYREISELDEDLSELKARRAHLEHLYELGIDPRPQRRRSSQRRPRRQSQRDRSSAQMTFDL